MNEWAESLARVSFPAAMEAVRNFRDNGEHDAPTCGEIYQVARRIDDRLAHDRRARVLRLEDKRAVTDEERRIAKETIAKIAFKIKTFGRSE
jgi:hypothetical protein